MKSSHSAEFARSAPTQYAPSVPMTVYRELAAELRANKSVIDSLNSRNQQLLQQNQMLKREIHNVVQASMSLGRAAGVAISRQGMPPDFPAAIAPDTLAKLVRDERQQLEQADYADPYEYPDSVLQPPLPVPIASPRSSNRTPRPSDRSVSGRSAERTVDFADHLTDPSIADPRETLSAEKRPAPAAKKVAKATTAPRKGIDRNLEKIAKRQKAARQAAVRNDTQHRASKASQPAPRMKPRAKPQAPKKLFTEQVGEHRNAPESEEIKEIGGIWLVLSIILIIVTAFGAGFLIMKPLLGDR